MYEFAEEIERIMAVPISEKRPWVVFGACREVDPDLFFPSTREDSDHAISICATCPVQIECLDYALEAGERYGIWGGLTEKKRRKAAGRLRRTA